MADTLPDGGSRHEEKARVTNPHSDFSRHRCHASPGRSTRNCTSRRLVTSVTYAVQPSGPPKQMLVGELPSTSTSFSTSPRGDSLTTVPLPCRVTYRLPSTSHRIPS